MHVFAIQINEEQILEKLEILARLQELQRSGRWSELRETNVEQSFSERVFGEVFGYDTLLGRPNVEGRTGQHQFPKIYVPLPSGGRAFPDLAMGWFRADETQTIVTAEWKGPGASLDKPQQGNYDGKTPVAQALEAAQGAGAEWCIVSNFDEVRLYRVPHSDAYERVILAEIQSPMALRRALALFSRESLVGNEPSGSGPLTRLYRHLEKGESMLVPRRPGRVRLVQRARPKVFDKEFPFARLSDALLRALEKVPDLNVLSGALRHPELKNDFLVMDRESEGSVWQRVAVAKTGLLVMSFAIPLDSNLGDDQPINISPRGVLLRLVEMYSFAWSFYDRMTSALLFEWSLEDLTPRAQVSFSEWIKPDRHPDTVLRCQEGVERTWYPQFEHDKAPKPNIVTSKLCEATRELFFPFDGTDHEGKLCRIVPEDEDVKEILAGSSALGVFQ